MPATLLLCPKSCHTPRPRPLVYPLAGGPLGAAAPATVDVASPLYSCRTVRVEVPNPLRESGDFEVRLTDKPQGERDLDTWLRSGVDAFPTMMLPRTVTLRARGKSRVDIEHMPWVARPRDYYALFSNAALGDFTVCFRSMPADPEPFAVVRPAHGWLTRLVQTKAGGICTEPSAGATPLVRRDVVLSGAEIQVRRGSHSENELFTVRRLAPGCIYRQCIYRWIQHRV